MINVSVYRCQRGPIWKKIDNLLTQYTVPKDASLLVDQPLLLLDPGLRGGPIGLDVVQVSLVPLIYIITIEILIPSDFPLLVSPLRTAAD